MLFRDRSMRGVLLDGFACATWKTEQRGGELTLVIEPFEPLTVEDRDVLAQEGERLLGFLAGPQGVGEFEVRFEGGDK
jgi:hypothetical protein